MAFRHIFRHTYNNIPTRPLPTNLSWSEARSVSTCCPTPSNAFDSKHERPMLDVMNISSILNAEECVEIPENARLVIAMEIDGNDFTCEEERASSSDETIASESSMIHPSSPASSSSTACTSPASEYSTISGCEDFTCRRSTGIARKKFNSNTAYTEEQNNWLLYHREDVRGEDGKVMTWDHDKEGFDQWVKGSPHMPKVERGTNNQGIQQSYYRQQVYPWFDENGKPVMHNGKIRMLKLKNRQRNSGVGRQLGKRGYFSFIETRPDLAVLADWVSEEHRLIAAQLLATPDFKLMPGVVDKKVNGIYKWKYDKDIEEWVPQIDLEKERLVELATSK